MASLTGMDFDTLINGEYRLLLEPVAYYRFQGVMIATTATEAALYDEQLGGKLRSKMISLTHKNLPLSMFLETADLGYPAWGGSRTSAASNSDIKSSLGLGIVRFKDAVPQEPELSSYDYEYRTNTEVITAVEVRGGQSDPDHPVSVIFHIDGIPIRLIRYIIRTETASWPGCAGQHPMKSRPWRSRWKSEGKGSRKRGLSP